MAEDAWPDLPLSEWKDTLATLHMWTQIVGKIWLKLVPLENRWRNMPLYVTSRGLTTSPNPYDDRLFQIDFDFIDHLLIIQIFYDYPYRPPRINAVTQQPLSLLD
jgi:hypothetical protein